MSDILGKKCFINLAYRTDRLEKIQKEFERIGIIGAKRIEALRNTENGRAGCVASHLNALEENKNEKRFTIFEDDCVFFDNAWEIFAKCEKQLPQDWDMLYLGANPQQKLERYSENLFRLKNAYTSHAIIFNNYRVVDFILQESKKEPPIRKLDVYYATVIQEKFNVYVTFPLIASQRDDYSDITNQQNDYYNTIIEGYKKNT